MFIWTVSDLIGLILIGGVVFLIGALLALDRVMRVVRYLKR